MWYEYIKGTVFAYFLWPIGHKIMAVKENQAYGVFTKIKESS